MVRSENSREDFLQAHDPTLGNLPVSTATRACALEPGATARKPEHLESAPTREPLQERHWRPQGRAPVAAEQLRQATKTQRSQTEINHCRRRDNGEKRGIM